MNQKLHFIWVDDNPERKQDADNLREELQIELDFVDVNKIEIDEILQNLVKKEEPDLIIMDHSLDKSYSRTYKTGSTAAAFIHEQWPSCPIISFTGVPIEDVDVRHKAAYEDMYPINHISEKYSELVAIANGFRQLKSNQPKNTLELLQFFAPPENDLEKLNKILPKELKENFLDKSLLLEIYRWTDSILFGRPGFLYDRKWTATILGLSLKGFNQVEDKFKDTMYSGVFSSENKERWWKSKVLKKLGSLTNNFGLPWIVGRSLVEDNPDNFSKCFASREDYPETVAAEDSTQNANWFPMKLMYTEPHPNYEDMLFFDELRIMKPSE